MSVGNLLLYVPSISDTKFPQEQYIVGRILESFMFMTFDHAPVVCGPNLSLFAGETSGPMDQSGVDLVSEQCRRSEDMFRVKAQEVWFFKRLSITFKDSTMWFSRQFFSISLT